MIKVINLTFGYGGKTLFGKAEFSVGFGQKVGLVGANGAGKSTLFKLLTGLETPFEGKIEVYGNIGFVPQEVKLDPAIENSTSVRSYLNTGSLHEDFQLKKMLSGLEMDDLDLDSLPKNLSGGQKTKLALCRALVSEPDLLLLDEPTNFLDETGKKWVMEFLSQYKKTLILISHDLVLIDRSIDRVLYINQHSKKIEEYKGNYTKFLKLKKEKEDLFKRHLIAGQKHIKQMEEGLRNLSRKTSKKGVRQRTILRHRIDRLKEKLPEMPPEARKIKLVLPPLSNVGEIPIKAVNIDKSYSRINVLKKVNFTIVRGERVALLGPNGSGKTTLIKILTGNLTPDEGLVMRDDLLSFGYYSQEFENFDLNKNLLDTLIDECKMRTQEARAFLGRFDFLGNKVFQTVGTLSGGEKTRLSIAILTANKHNLLILDEPTTYLDVLSQRIILEALKQYQGTMLVVSHTKQFIAELKPDKAFLMPEGRMVLWSDELLEEVEKI